MLSGIHCGIKRKRLDLGLIYCKSFGRAVGFFTSNANPSYSVTLSKKNVHNQIKAILVNSGNANCFSHTNGLKDTQDICRHLAELLQVDRGGILIASTGIIGKKLPKQKIIQGLPHLISKLAMHTDDFSKSILTTDTFKKISYACLGNGKNKVTIVGFAKGAGMIYPQLATMLGFILTDARLPYSVFKKIATSALEVSFNSITVDACMSTNDTVFYLTSGLRPLGCTVDEFGRALRTVSLDLAKMIIKDAEGATKFIEIEVQGAPTQKDAKRASLAIANYNLFKCALYGENPNWGRVVAALGQAGFHLNNRLTIKTTPLKNQEIKITVNLKQGRHNWKVYTSDLTPGYIRENASYS